MNPDHYRQRLLDLETKLVARTSHEADRGRDQHVDGVADTGDASTADETVSENFSEAELDSTMLGQVRDALRRIEEGTFGQCVVDGGPIEAKRLEASPWTPYCLKHQAEREADVQSSTL
jgi:DnaK suppressor protein